MEACAPSPVPRIATLDVIRGVAVMGILVMNVIGFAMPQVAYTNPTAYGGHTGADFVSWLVDFIFIDGKMRGLFSFLFGASMLLVIERATAKGENPARVHFSRMFWLFIFGMAHLTLLWWGDILNHYALIGAVAWVFRKQPPHKLVALAISLIAAQTILVAGLPLGIHMNDLAMQTAHPPAAAIAAHQAFQQHFGTPDSAFIAHDLALYRGGYAGIVTSGLGAALNTPLQDFIYLGMETLAYMLLGMAGLRSGMLTGAWAPARYRRWVAIGFGIGVPAYALLAIIPIARHFDPFSVTLSVMTLSTPFRPAMIVGWACLIVLFARPGGALTTRIAAAGRMAFTNYLGTTILCTTLFYGYGFGLYGRLSRAELDLVVIAVCALMLLWSKPWLTHFRYGPFEWLWRSLARWRLQPMRGGALSASCAHPEKPLFFREGGSPES